MVLLRKEHQGSDSHGHVWPEDGAVVDVSPEDAAALTRIPDGGYTVADAPDRAVPAALDAADEPADTDQPLAVAPDEPEPVTDDEPVPDPAPTAAPARRGGRPTRKAA